MAQCEEGTWIVLLHIVPVNWRAVHPVDKLLLRCQVAEIHYRCCFLRMLACGTLMLLLARAIKVPVKQFASPRLTSLEV